MYGAIIGDVVGSIYEFNNHKSKDFEFFDPRCFFTDDTAMSLAIASVGLAVLCHDLGKPMTTKFEDGRLRSLGHEEAGLEPTLSFLRRITNEERILKEVPPLVTNHMVPYSLWKSQAGDSAIRRLAVKVVRIDRLLRVCRADGWGRPPAKPRCVDVDWLEEKANQLAVEKSVPKPIVQGRDLIALGYKPSVKFGKWLSACFEAQLDGKFIDHDGGMRYFKEVVGQERKGQTLAGKKARVVVMGGSFNPPTLAHLRLLQAAVEGIEASRGVFVPSSFVYVGRKMRHVKTGRICIPENVRLRMLQALCAEDPRLEVDTVEFGAERPCTLETLSEISKRNPAAEIFFMIGTDKLYDIKRWSTREEVLRKFRIVAFEREGEDAEELVLRDPFLKCFADSFVFLSSPPGVAGVSSTVARERLFAGESCASLLHPKVERLFKAYVEEESARKDEIQKIMQFDGPYDFLSNFYEASIEFEGVTYQTSEAAFQAQKCINPEDRVAFAELSAAKAKRYGRKVPLRPDWEDVKVELMERIVRAKFTQHQELAQRLLATNDLPLVEGNTWFDLFWGVDVGTGRGKNLLGKILMKVRDELVKIEEMDEAVVAKNEGQENV